MSGAKVIAQYFPQLHPIPENDRWWGKGFTDWVNVKKAKPLFRGHYQPRVPLAHDYYDQSREDVIRAQVDIAKQYGIHGFCHYHYWFDGKQLLETPTNLFLAAKDIDFRFCLAWANETWSKRWDGLDHHILQEQTHPPRKERWELHFRYLIQAWSDPRAIRIDGKPVFLIYRPARIPRIASMFDYWQTRAREHGLPGLYFVAIHQFGVLDPKIIRHFDAVMLFQPFVSMFGPAMQETPLWRRALSRARRALQVPDRTAAALQHAIDNLRGPKRIDYDTVWRNIVSQPLGDGKTTFPGAFVDWDNTARYGRRATIYEGATPERFEFWMRRLLGAVTANREEERFIFVNAWNEWAEGAYLEPDERYGYLYLDALRRALGVEAPAARKVSPLREVAG